MVLAEREGFEPSVPRKEDNGFRVLAPSSFAVSEHCWFRPIVTGTADFGSLSPLVTDAHWPLAVANSVAETPPVEQPAARTGMSPRNRSVGT